jgi:HlyD family secretion protein
MGVDSREFHPDIVGFQRQLPSPMPRRVLHAVLALFAVLLIWAWIGRLDIVALAQGKLVPWSYLKIVQPAEPGIVHEILVREGQEVGAGQVLVRMDTRMADADGRALYSELQRKRLQLRALNLNWPACHCSVTPTIRQTYTNEPRRNLERDSRPIGTRSRQSRRRW